MRHLSVQIAGMDCTWIKLAYRSCLTVALKHLQLEF